MNKKRNIKSKGKINNPNSDINVPNTIKPLKPLILLLFILFIIFCLIGRLFYLQIIDGESLQASATSQQTMTETISAKRGTIYDSTGKALAMSYDTDKVSITPSKIADENKSIIAQGLASMFELDYNEFLNKLNTSTSKFTVASNVDQDKINELNTWISKLNDAKIVTGISIEETTTRYYPYGSLASTIIGFTGADGQGSSGIEYSWDSFLSGTSGKSVSLKDANQSEIVNSEQTYISAENGYDITLTIDSNIQTIVEKYLAEAVEQYLCDSGICIAMSPSTGKILAMADYPSYDCNSPYTINSSLEEIWDTLSDEEKLNSKYAMWKPKAVTDTYEPGSVFKLITSAIALEEGITDTDIPNTFTCEGEYYIEGEKKPISCWKNYHGPQSLRQGLANSCNPFFIQLGLKIGANLSYKYYDAFGFFDKTGISLSGEPNGGIFYDLEKIKPIELAVMSFGQRFTITPLQMITAVSAIANDGVLVKPKIVEKITNTDTGEVTNFDTEVVRKVVSKETADKVASMMESVITDGTGKLANVAGYSIGGKSGTSEPIWSSTNDGYVASFVAISPVENTQIAILVILNNPGENINHNGGQIAAPTVQKMLTEILPYMGVETGNKNNVDTSNVSSEDLY